MTHRVRNIISDDGRARVQDFFNQHIPAKYKPLPVFPTSIGDRWDVQVAAVIDEGEVLGAVHWAIDFEDSETARRDMGEQIGDAMERDVRILQNIAVSEAARGTGIGRALVEYAEQRSLRSGAHVMIGVATGNAGGFFSELGYSLHPTNTALSIPLPSVRTMLVLPLTGDDVRWFAKPIGLIPASDAA